MGWGVGDLFLVGRLRDLVEGCLGCGGDNV